MAVRSDLLAAQQRAPGTNVEYTTPAGTTTLLKDVRVSISGTVLSSCKVQLQRLASSQPTILNVTTPAAGTLTLGALSGFMVLEPGDQIVSVVAGVGAVCDMWFSGAELAGVAP